MVSLLGLLIDPRTKTSYPKFEIVICEGRNGSLVIEEYYPGISIFAS